MQINATVLEGRLSYDPDDKKRMLAYFSKCPDFTRFRVVIEREVANRSTEANAFYWAILNELSSHTGNHTDDLHEFLKVKLLGKRVRIGKKYVVKPGSTAKMDKDEFRAYLEKVRAFCIALSEGKMTMPTFEEWKEQKKKEKEKFGQSDYIG